MKIWCTKTGGATDIVLMRDMVQLCQIINYFDSLCFDLWADSIVIGADETVGVKLDHIHSLEHLNSCTLLTLN